jgi:hypothetical protein
LTAEYSISPFQKAAILRGVAGLIALSTKSDISSEEAELPTEAR